MCKVTDKQIAADGAAVASAVKSIANAVKSSNPTLAAELTTAADTLVTATENYQSGSALTDINTAANAIEAILAVIPATAPYATFVAIAVAALDVLLANMATQPTQGPSAVANAVAVQNHIETLPDNQFRGLVRIHRNMFEGPRTALIRTWNNQVEAQPELGFAKL